MLVICYSSLNNHLLYYSPHNVRYIGRLKMLYCTEPSLPIRKFARLMRHSRREVRYPREIRATTVARVTTAHSHVRESCFYERDLQTTPTSRKLDDG